MAKIKCAECGGRYARGAGLAVHIRKAHLKASIPIVPAVHTNGATPLEHLAAAIKERYERIVQIEKQIEALKAAQATFGAEE